jgi:predicted outer membrane protein
MGRLFELIFMILRQLPTALATTAVVPVFFAAPQIFAAAAETGEAEKKHADITKAVGSLSLATSRLAVEMSSAYMVKMFAKFEVAEQETIADILKSMEMEKAEGALKVPTDAEVEAMLDPTGKEALVMLKGLNGAGFDMASVPASAMRFTDPAKSDAHVLFDDQRRAPDGLAENDVIGFVSAIFYRPMEDGEMLIRLDGEDGEPLDPRTNAVYAGRLARALINLINQNGWFDKDLSISDRGAEIARLKPLDRTTYVCDSANG